MRDGGRSLHGERPFQVTVMMALLFVGPRPFTVVGQAPELELTERASWTAPAELAVSGAASSPSGRIFVWSRDPARVITLDSNLEVVSDTRSPTAVDIVAVGIGPDGTTEIISRDPAGLSRTNRGDQWSFHPLDLDGTPSAAARNGSGWYVRLRAAAAVDSVWTVLVGDDGTPEAIFDEGAASGSATLTATDSSVILTATRPPHRWLVLDGRGAGSAGQPPPALLDSLSAAIGPGVQRQWRAVGTVPLDRGYLQSIADLTSNWRVLVLYDEQGSPLRNPIYRLPMGIFGSHVESASLYALVRLNQTEVIRYQWRWRRPAG